MPPQILQVDDVLGSQLSSRNGTQHRVAVLYYGLLTRTNKKNQTMCTSEGIKLQRYAAASHRKHLLSWAEKYGLKLDLFISANKCPKRGRNSWKDTVKGFYAPWPIKQMALDSCETSLSGHCHIHRGLQMLLAPDENGAHHSTHRLVAERYQVILMIRPDLILAEEVEGVLASMFLSSLKGSISWPFWCEGTGLAPGASSCTKATGTAPRCSSDCVADTLVTVPGAALASYNAGCLGRDGCHPDAYDDYFNGRMNIRYDHVSRYEPPRTNLPFNGHACHRCVEQVREKLRNANGKKTLNSTDLQSPDARRLKSTSTVFVKGGRAAGIRFEDSQMITCNHHEQSRTASECEASCLAIRDRRCRAWTFEPNITEGSKEVKAAAVNASAFFSSQCCLYSYAAGLVPGDATIESGIIATSSDELALGQFGVTVVLDEQHHINTRHKEGKIPYYSFAML